MAREASRLTGMEPDRIEGLELIRPGRDTIRLERITGGGWRMTSPYRIAADSERVARLLGVTGAGVVRSFPAQGVDLKVLGLEPDPVRISLGGQTLRFGSTDPIDRLRYVASGDLVHLTEDRFYHFLIGPAADYVDLGLIPSGEPPASADLNGEPLAPATLADLAALRAERVEPMGGDLDGRILRVRPSGDAPALRFLVSEDGLRWSRPDLRLTYLVPSPPPALVETPATPPVAPVTLQAPAAGAFAEQVVGVIQGPKGAAGTPGQVRLTRRSRADAGPPHRRDPRLVRAPGGPQRAHGDARRTPRPQRPGPGGRDRGAARPAPASTPRLIASRPSTTPWPPPSAGPRCVVRSSSRRMPRVWRTARAIVTPEQARHPPPAVKLRPD